MKIKKRDLIVVLLAVALILWVFDPFQFRAEDPTDPQEEVILQVESPRGGDSFDADMTTETRETQ
ncbi:MAG: hypothetical protein WDZ88_00705 [Candidatus Paceibacterota bacterium]